MNVEKWVSGGAPGISAARLNQPFHVISAVYDAGDDEVDVTIGHGRADNGNGVVDENTSDTVLNITSPAVSTTYYIFYKSDGTFTFSTTAKPAINTRLLASVTTADPLGDATTIADLRNLLPSSTFPKWLFDADGDTGIEVERTADGDIVYIKAGGTDRAQIDSNGMTLSAGASVNEFSTDGTLAGNSDDACPTEKAVKTYVDTLIGGASGEGIAKAWCEVNGNTPVILDSFNIDSITDTATGRITVTISTDFADTSYAVGLGVGSFTVINYASKAAGSIIIETRDVAGNLGDTYFSMIAIGDQ